MKEEDNVKDIFKYTKEIKEGAEIPKDFKNMFKNVETIKEIPPVPKNFNTEHLQEFINEFDIDLSVAGAYSKAYVENLQSQLKAKEEVIKEALDKIETLRMEKWAIMGTDIMDIMEILSKGENK